MFLTVQIHFRCQLQYFLTHPLSFSLFAHATEKMTHSVPN